MVFISILLRHERRQTYKHKFLFYVHRAQAEQHTLVGGQLSRLQSAVSLGLEQINERVTIMENKLRTFSSKQDETVQSLETIKEKVVDIHKRSSSSGNSRKHSSRVLDANTSQRNKSTNSSHSSHHLCTEVKQTIRTMDNKIDYMYKRINIGSGTVKDLPFTNDSNAVLEDGSDYFMDSIDHDFEGIMLNKPLRSSPHTQSTSSSHKQFLKLLRRITLPFKKANKRLRQMEDIRHRFTTSLDQMRLIVNTLMVDSDRRYNEFYNLTMDMFDQQHISLQSYERKFASLQQCCQGTASDLAGFEAKAMSAFKRINTLFTSNAIERELLPSPTFSSSR